MSDALEVHQELTKLESALGQIDSVDNYHHAMVPEGYEVKDLTDAIEKAGLLPHRIRGTVTLKDLPSLLAYCKDMSVPERAYIYADPDSRQIVAVFNDVRDRNPGWRDHRAVFKAEFTPEFTRWSSSNAKQFPQTEFAEFIEDNMADITEPNATVMLDMATTIQAKTDISFSSAKRLQNGQVQLGYTETIDARAGVNGAIEIPKEFSLGLRLFKNGQGYKLKARLKYRLHSGGVKFWYELDRPERAIEDAFAGYVQQVTEQSGYQVLVGTP